VWDLLSGQEIGRLRGHSGSIKCLQVEDHVCLTGSEDGTVRLWDLRRVEDDEWQTDDEMVNIRDAFNNTSEDGEMVEKPNGIRGSSTTVISDEREGPFVRLLEGHSKAVTTLCFEDDCLVSLHSPALFLEL
jgi:mitochondrial division protein 1